MLFYKNLSRKFACRFIFPIILSPLFPCCTFVFFLPAVSYAYNINLFELPDDVVDIKLCMENKTQQNGSYQDEALNVATAS